MGDGGLGGELRGEGRQRLGIDVGRVGQDQVVAAPGVGGEEIGLGERNARLEPIVGDIAPGHLEGVRRDVAGIDRGLRERQCRENGEAAGARAQVEDRADRSRPGAQVPFPFRCVQLPAQQLAEIGAGHDDALVDIEGVGADPGLVGEVGRRLAGGDAPLEDVAHLAALGGDQAGVEPGVELIDGQVQRVQDQVGGLIERIAGAVPVAEAGGVEARHGVAQPIAHGDELVLYSIRVGHLCSAGDGGHIAPLEVS